MRYQDVKQMISQKWQVQSRENSESLTDKDTIPADLFWVICGSDSESERRLLPVMNEIMRRLQNMGLILIFLFVSWCSIIFFGRTFKISSVVSKVAVFVAGVITRLFFKGLTKEKRFSGLTRRQMLEKIENAVKHNIERKTT